MQHTLEQQEVNEIARLGRLTQRPDRSARTDRADKFWVQLHRAYKSSRRTAQHVIVLCRWTCEPIVAPVRRAANRGTAKSLVLT